MSSDYTSGARHVEVNGYQCSTWSQGEGKRIFWLASSPLLLKQTRFRDGIASSARLITCALPGFPGSEGHDCLDVHLDWCLAARDLLLAAGFQPGDTLMGSATAGAIAADVAALWSDWVGKLVLLAPFGLFDMEEQPADMFAVRPKESAALFSANSAAFAEHMKAPEGTEPVLWQIVVTRGNEAAARFLWPLGDTRLKKRLHRVKNDTLLVWGAEDRVMPPTYAARFKAGIAGNSVIRLIPGAGHLVEFDQPAAVAGAVLEFVA
jgi:pimeloyl-ACP methyl ester carboxylesterase